MTSTSTAQGWRALLSPGELDELLELHDWRSWISIATNWGLVAASFALVASVPHVVTVLVALFVIGARQLGLAILMHEAAHRTLLRNRRWNDRVGSWLCAYPIWSDLYPYRRYHLVHHARTWTQEDPDLELASRLPVSRASMLRKVGRDLSGRTGLKFARGALKRSLARRPGPLDGPRSLVGTVERRAFYGMLVTNAILLGILTACGRPELYLLWVGAWLTTHTLVTRFRSIAEHSMISDPADPLQNTRTTLARWWERLLIAPNRVNYHLEHHLLITVPHYHLKRFHELLKERGALEGACVEQGYGRLLLRAASKPSSP